MLCVSPVKNLEILPNLGNFTHITSSPRYPKGNTHAEKAVGMVKQIYNHCDDPLYGMLILKMVPLLDVKESPDKIFFGRSLHTNLPKPGIVHTDYENRYINQDTQGNTSNTHNFGVNDPVWIKLSDDLPWKSGVVEKVHDHQSYTVQVEGKMYRRNTHHLTRRYPQRQCKYRKRGMTLVTPHKRNLDQGTKLRCLGFRHRLLCIKIFHLNELDTG